MHEHATLSDYVTKFKQASPWARKHPAIVWVGLGACAAAVLIGFFSLASSLVLGRFW